MNIHLPCGINGLNEQLLKDSIMNADELIACFDYYQNEFSNMLGGNFMIFNQKIKPKGVQLFTDYVKSKMENVFFTLLVDFREFVFSDLDKMQKSGISAIKFHSYVQKISDDDFSSALVCAKNAEKLSLPIFIDTSFGTTKMYQYDNLKLAACLLDEIKDVPIVLLHTGCSRALEAFLLAASCENVFLDTSFSVATYLGSSIEQDLSFSYKKIGFDKVVYGSDMPYVSCEKSLKSINTFFDNQNISLKQQEKVLSESWRGVFYE